MRSKCDVGCYHAAFILALGSYFMPDEDDKKPAVVTLIENTPLAIIVLGVCLVVLGAAGGWPKYGVEIKTLGWQIALVVIGILTSVVGFLLERISNKLVSANVCSTGIRLVASKRLNRRCRQCRFGRLRRVQGVTTSAPPASKPSKPLSPRRWILSGRRNRARSATFLS